MSIYALTAMQMNETPQNQPVLGRTDQKKNNAGGYVFTISPLEQLRRFLILGSAGGTYYASEQKLTKDNATNIIDIFRSSDCDIAIALIRQVSVEGLAAKQSPTLFAYALAFAYSSRENKALAASYFQAIIRTQSHLFEFISYVRQFRGMGRLLRNTIRAWYQDMSAIKLSYQMIKYRNRNGYTTRDVLRLVKPKPKDEEHDELYKFATRSDKKEIEPSKIELIQMFDAAQAQQETPDLHLAKNLPREALPTQWLNHPEVWKTLLPTMPLTALIRNLGKMSSIGVLGTFSSEVELICKRLTDQGYIQQSKLHPFSILLALTTYRAGRGVKGSLSWEPNQHIVSALEDAFYLAFKNIEPTGKRTLIGLDVSGSMGAEIMDTHISCAEAAAAMCMVTARLEKQYTIMSFQNTFVPLDISATDSLTDVVKKTHKLNFGSTDCAQPMLYALERNIPVDSFLVYTDSETWYGKIHPYQALNKYRKAMNINAKLVVVGMTATNFSIADPTDPGMLDVVGFSSDAPSVIADFCR